jgi:hypothetical protein
MSQVRIHLWQFGAKQGRIQGVKSQKAFFMKFAQTRRRPRNKLLSDGTLAAPGGQTPVEIFLAIKHFSVIVDYNTNPLNRRTGPAPTGM